MREDLIERLRTELVSANKHGDPDLADLLRDTLAALEAAREALDREAALKGGVEHQRDTLWAELEAAREDGLRIKRDIAELYEVMPILPITTETMEAATDWFTRYCIDFYREINAAQDAAIDQARGIVPEAGQGVDGG